MTTKDQFVVLLGILLSALISLGLMILFIYGGYSLARWLTL